MKTWKQIKEEIEAQGVEDADEVQYIDIDGYDDGFENNDYDV